MGHFDNIWCRYKRYYFGKTLKCEIKSYSLGRPKCFGRFSTAKVEVGTPGSFLKFNLNHRQLNQSAKWLRSNSKVLWRRVSERGILACMHVLKASHMGADIGQFSCKANHKILLDFIWNYLNFSFLWLKTCVFGLLIVHARFGWWHFGKDGCPVWGLRECQETAPCQTHLS